MMALVGQINNGTAMGQGYQRWPGTPMPLPFWRRDQVAQPAEQIRPEVMPSGTPAAAIAAQPLPWARQPTGDLSMALNGVAPTGDLSTYTNAQVTPSTPPVATTSPSPNRGSGAQGKDAWTRSEYDPLSSIRPSAAGAPAPTYDPLSSISPMLRSLFTGSNYPGPNEGAPASGGTPGPNPAPTPTAPLPGMKPPQDRGGNGDSRSGYAGERVGNPLSLGGAPAASAPSGTSGWNMGPIDMSVIGPIASALGGLIPGAGLLGTIGNVYNGLQYDDTMAAQGIPPMTTMQWLGAITGLGPYGTGNADPLRNAFDITDGQGGENFQLKPGVGGPQAGWEHNPNYGVSVAGRPMDIRPNQPIGGWGANNGYSTPGTNGGAARGASPREDPRIGPGTGGIY